MSSPDAATAATLLGVGVRTRAQKRRRGDESNSSLWDVVVKCDDITFTHSSEVEWDGCEIFARSEQ